MKKLNHVSIAVENVDQALGFYRDILGLEVTRIVTLEDRQLKIAFIKIGDTELELLEPLNQDNTVRRYLDRWGPGLHHICLEVDDVAATMEALQNRGAEFTDSVPRPGAVGQVAFIHPNSSGGVLVEINELPRTEAGGSGAETALPPAVTSDASSSSAGAAAGATAQPSNAPTTTPPTGAPPAP